MDQSELEQWAFEDFARCYPHEAAELEWPKFVAFTQKLNPQLTEAAIRELLRKTEQP